MDPTARDALWQKLYALTKTGVSILVTTHYVDEAERCSAVGYLNHGQIIAEAPPDELASKLGLKVWHVTDISQLPKSKSFLAVQTAISWRVIGVSNNYQTDELQAYYAQAAVKPVPVPARLSDALSWLAASKETSHEN